MKKTNYQYSSLTTTEVFNGESIEEKVRRVTENNEPIEAVSPMYYNERKAGVEAATDIRTDRFEVALNAMDSIHMGTRQKREERMAAAEKAAKSTDKPEV